MAGKTIQDIAILIREHLTLANPILPAVVASVGGLVGDTPVVTVTVGDATRQATYLPPHAISAGDKCFAGRMGPDLAAPWVVWATNIQGVPRAP